MNNAVIFITCMRFPLLKNKWDDTHTSHISNYNSKHMYEQHYHIRKKHFNHKILKYTIQGLFRRGQRWHFTPLNGTLP